MGSVERWVRRWRAKRRLRRDVAIWHHPEYALHALAKTERAPFVDVVRADRVAGALVGEGLIRGRDLRRPEPATMEALLRAHSADWMERSADARVLSNVLGVEPAVVPVDEVLTAQRRATGGTLAAARAAAAGEVAKAFNLGGGFHHAGPEQGAAFCVYNDLAVAVAGLRALGLAERVAVVDLDYHHGDGTRLVFADDANVLTFSIHGAARTYTEAVADESYALPPGTTDGDYLEFLDGALSRALANFRPEIVFYVAGNDVLAGDRLGDFALTPAGVFERDRHVTEVTERAGAPLVVTMGGGYSKHAWRCTYAYAAWLLSGQEHAVEGDEDAERSAHYDRVAATLTPSELQHDDALSLATDDIVGELTGASHTGRILGFYSAHGLELALERYGFFDRLRELGFDDLRLDVDPAAPPPHLLRVRGRRRGTDGPLLLLVELVLQLRNAPMPAAADTEMANRRRALQLLSLEWLLLQDPSRPFSLQRPPLVGQQHPGLGCAREVIGLLAQVCKRLDLDGAVMRPRYYHVALYGAPPMQFLDPAREGQFAAIRHALREADYAEATALIAAGHLRRSDGTPIAWEPDDFVLAISERLRSWLSSETYQRIRDAERDRLLAREPHITARPSSSANPP